MNYSVENLKRLLGYILIAAIFFAIASLVGCKTAKHDFKSVNKAILQHPAQTAKQLNEKWPCVPLVTVSDSTAYKQYMADIKSLQDFYATNKPDTVIETIIESWADTVKITALKKQVAQLTKNENYLQSYIADLTKLCGDKPPVHDTVKIESYAKIAMIAGQLEVAEGRNATLQGKNDKLQSWRLWLIVAVVCFGGYTGFSIYKKFAV